MEFRFLLNHTISRSKPSSMKGSGKERKGEGENVVFQNLFLSKCAV